MQHACVGVSLRLGRPLWIVACSKVMPELRGNLRTINIIILLFHALGIDETFTQDISYPITHTPWQDPSLSLNGTHKYVLAGMLS